MRRGAALSFSRELVPLLGDLTKNTVVAITVILTTPGCGDRPICSRIWGPYKDLHLCMTVSGRSGPKIPSHPPGAALQSRVWEAPQVFR